ncbi:hypothetical protein SAMN04488078_1005123 [Antarctobacter heliothermus]|uniref:Uncharacterized protein n=2 Tax=Antarctobacter heliothermus TaxID=74033 RepID=A0A239C4R3_9RHOB|nr:hypothetical protein SAMN04488078_1005123 [Antarctobacter heliothermus]
MLFSLVVGLGLTCGPALSGPIADVICAPTDQMIRKLTHNFGTTRSASGLRSPDEMLEIWADSDGDWTMVIAYASGQSCIVAMGAHWQETGAKSPTRPPIPG